MLDIQRMITLSTAHVSEETAKELDKMATNALHIPEIAVYNKEGFGWFIYCVQDTPLDGMSEQYDDLKKIIVFAHDHECNIICLDCDYETVDYLPTYDW